MASLLLQGALDPGAQQAAAHGGGGLVQYPQQRPPPALAPGGLGQFQIAKRHPVQRHIALGFVVLRGDDVGQGVFLGLRKIGKQRPRRAHRQPLAVEAQIGDGLAEVGGHHLRREGIGEALLLQGLRPIAALRLVLQKRGLIVDDQLAGVQSRQFVGRFARASGIWNR